MYSETRKLTISLIDINKIIDIIESGVIFYTDYCLTTLLLSSRHDDTVKYKTIINRIFITIYVIIDTHILNAMHIAYWL